MHADNQHLLVVRTIEYADSSAFWQTSGSPPEKIMLQLFRARLFKAENLAALRVDPGHHVPDCAIFARCVRPLENQEQGIAVRRIVETLQRAQSLDVVIKKLLIMLL